ncbi:MAG: glycosyltransferase N-terminal domain-containing protein [Aliarcobacter sp.]
MSDKSYNSYKKFSFFIKRIFENKLIKVFKQTIEDKKRLEELGAKNIEVIGNIKLAQLPKKKIDFDKPNEILITAASTVRKEEN